MAYPNQDKCIECSKSTPKLPEDASEDERVCDECNEKSELNHVTIYGFVTEEDLEKNRESHIDSLTQEGDWEDCVLSIIEENKDTFYHITVESDDGKPLPSFSS
jgi:hypothetical protein